MKQQSAIQQKIKLIKNQNYFCDERSHPSQTQISQNDITNNIYYKLDQMKQDDLLNRERSISDYIKPVNNSRISNIHKQIYQFSNSHAKHNQNLVENHYFTQGIGKQNSVSGQKLINNSQNNTKYSQNNFLSSFSQEGYYSDSQKLTPRMNFYLQSRIQQNDVKITQDSNLQYNQSSSSYGISPRHYFNYKLLLQSNKISPIQLISKIASNSTVQECGINSKSKELGDNFENLQKQKNNDDEKGSKQIESIIYDEELDSQNKQLKDSSFFINSHTASDLILEDMTPGQFKISDAPSFLDQKHEALLNISNSNNYDYPLIDNLQNDSFYLNQNYQQLTDSELILKNPNEFFQKIGIKPLQVNKNKKKPLNQFLTEHVEKELGMMKKFDQGQIKDQKLNQSHFNNFVQQSKQLIQEDQQQSYQDIILEKKQVEKLRFDSPKCSQKNMNMIMLKNKYNVVKERIKIEKKDLTTSYLYENQIKASKK